MATMMTVETVSGTTVKNALNFLKAYRPRFTYMEILRAVAVYNDTWRVTDLVCEATVPAPIALPDGVYDLFAILPVLSRGAVHVEITEDTVRVNGCPVRRFPDDLPMPFLNVSASDRGVELGTLPEGWALLQNHADTDETRPVLRGIRLDAHEHQAVATNGARLSRVAWPALGRLSDSVTIPNVPLKDKHVSMRVQYSGRTPIAVTLTGESGTVRARMVEGQYPEYVRVIPDQSAHQLVIHTTGAALLAWAQQGLQLAKANNRLLSMDIIQGTVPMDGTGVAHIGGIASLALSSAGAQSMTDLGADWAQGTGSILVNPQYVVDVAKGLRNGTPIAVAVTGVQSPLVFSAGDQQAIVMPIRAFA